MRRLVLISLFLLAACGAARTEVPETIHYQGKLSDTNGLANTSTSMVFRIFDADTGGTELYAETQQVLVVDGLYAVSLGTSNAPGSDLAVAVTNTGVYLELQVGDQVLAPREAVQSVAYALIAAAVPDGSITTAKLDKYAVTSIKIADGAVTNAQLAAEAVTTAKLADDAVTGDKISDASITASDIATNTFWQTLGNTAITPGTHFIGTTDNQPFDIRVNNIRGLRVEYAELPFDPFYPSPNIIGGVSSNQVIDGGIATVIAGGGLEVSPNIASDDAGFIGSGLGNRVGDFDAGSDGDYATVVNGEENWAMENFSSILNGRTNLVTASYSTVIGGRDNRIHESYAVIGGGRGNTITGDYGIVAGGYGNTVTSDYAAVSGGQFNKALGEFSSVGGGYSNTVLGEKVFVGGGQQNTAAGRGSAVLGGYFNRADGESATVAGGGGLDLVLFTVVSNRALGDFSIVGGGGDNVASGRYAAVIAGKGNNAGGAGSFIAGGGSNETQGTYAFAAGFNAKALHNGTFVWADTSGNAFESDIDNAFLVRATNGVGINVTSPSATLHVVGRTNLGTIMVGPDAGVDEHSEFILAETRDGRYGMKLLYDGSNNLFHIVGLQNYTNTAPHLTITRSAGNVGLGSADPQYNLEVVGGPTLGTLLVAPDEPTWNQDSEILLGENADATFGMRMLLDGSANQLKFYGVEGGTNHGPHLVINRDTSRVGIATETLASGYALSVGGAIRAEEVVVETGWADFVFDDDYILLPLTEVEKIIQAEKSLPDIPTAKEVQAEGVSLGEMQTRMLQKIEELTLYTIQQQKEIEQLKFEVETLRAQ